MPRRVLPARSWGWKRNDRGGGLLWDTRGGAQRLPPAPPHGSLLGAGGSPAHAGGERRSGAEERV